MARLDCSGLDKKAKEALDTLPPRVRKDMEDRLDLYAAQLGSDKAAFDRLAVEIKIAKDVKETKVAITHDIIAEIDTLVEGQGREAGRNILGRVANFYQDRVRGESFETQHLALRNEMLSRLTTFNHYGKHNLKGKTGKEGQEIIYDAIRWLGNNELKVANQDSIVIAKEIKDVLDLALAEKRSVGEYVARRKDFWMVNPRTDTGTLHALVRKAAKDGVTNPREAVKKEWIAKTARLVSPERMVSRETGLPPIKIVGGQTVVDDEQLNKILGGTFDTFFEGSGRIREVKLGGSTQGRNTLSGEVERHRVLSFRDGDAWLDYDREYGGGDIFGQMSGYVDSVSSDVALKKSFGPTPDTMIRYAREKILVEKQRLGREGNRKDANFLRKSLKEIQVLDDMISGRTFAPDDTPWNMAFASFMSASRNWTTAAALGSSVITALPTDLINSMHRRSIIGLEQVSMIRLVKDIYQRSDPGDRALAARHAASFDDLNARLFSRLQDFGEVSTGISKKAADFTIRISGLSRWTATVRENLQHDILTGLATNRAVSWDKLPKGYTDELLRESGIDSKMWERFKNLKTIKDRWERDTFDMRDLFNHDRNLYEKIQGLLFRESELAIPTGSLAARGKVPTARAGTFAGEVTRSIFYLKQFPIMSVFYSMRQFQRLSQDGKRGAAIGRLASNVLLLWTAGIAAEMFNNVAAGKEPEITKNLLWKGFTRGSGVGFIGETVVRLSGDDYTAGDMLANLIGGPLAGPAFSLGRAALDGAGISGEEAQEKAGGRALNVIRYKIPGQSTWFSKLLFHQVFDTMQAAIDPNSTEFFARKKASAKKRGTPYYIAPNSVFGEGT